MIHKKSRGSRQLEQFKGRSYRSYNKEIFKERLLDHDWTDYYSITSSPDAWNYIVKRITAILDEMCPIRAFHIKNYRLDWMTGELIEQIKDRDYFYKKAKMTGDEDAWNILTGRE